MKKNAIFTIDSLYGKNKSPSTNQDFITEKWRTQNPLAWEIKTHVMAAGYAQKEAAEACPREIVRIEAHNERTKESYASNPVIDPTRTPLNFHLVILMELRKRKTRNTEVKRL